MQLPNNPQLILDFVLANLAAELVKYLGLKFYIWFDNLNETFLDVD